MLDSGEEIALFGVRDLRENERGGIERARPLSNAEIDQIDALCKDTALVFYSDFGQRRQAAAEHFRLRGCSKVYALAGGIDACSREVDSGAPRL